MGVRFPFAATSAIVNNTVLTSTETVVLSTPQFSPPLDNAAVLIMVMWSMVTPGTVTNYNYNLRRGNLVTSPLVNVGNQVIVEPLSSRFLRMLMFVDTPGALGPVQYSLSIVGNGATGNTLLDYGTIVAMAL